MPTPRTIAGIEFPTQKAANEHCGALVQRWYSQRQKRNRRSFCQTEVPVAGEDRDFVNALFLRHPEHDEKLAEARSRGYEGQFCVAPNAYGKPCLCLLTEARPFVEFSYRRAIKEADVIAGDTAPAQGEPDAL